MERWHALPNLSRYGPTASYFQILVFAQWILLPVEMHFGKAGTSGQTSPAKAVRTDHENIEAEKRELFDMLCPFLTPGLKRGVL